MDTQTLQNDTELPKTTQNIELACFYLRKLLYIYISSISFLEKEAGRHPYRVLIGFAWFRSVLGSFGPPPPPPPPPPEHPKPPTQKAHHSPPHRICTETQKVCTENLTKSPKYDNIKAVLVEINRTERGAQASRKENEERKKGNYNETRKKTRHHQGKHPRKHQRKHPEKISRPRLGSIQERYSRRRNEMKTDLKASLLTKEVTRLTNKYPEARWWRLADLVRTLYKHQCGFEAEHEGGRRILSFDLLTLDPNPPARIKPTTIKAVYERGLYQYLPSEETSIFYESRLFRISPAKPFGEGGAEFKQDFYSLLTSAVILSIKWKVEQATKGEQEDERK